MLRMEIALFLVLAFVAFIYFSAQRIQTPIHQTFSTLLIVMLVHLVFDGITVYTVNHLESVPRLLNNLAHRVFIGTMILVFFLFYQYIAILVEEETGKKRRMEPFTKGYLILAEIAAMVLPIRYTITPQGNYSDGIHVYAAYASVAVYFLFGAVLFLLNRNHIQKKKKMAISIVLIAEVIVTILQGIHHTWLISGMGATLVTLSFYLILENPDILRAELVEQKMSMLYLKSQVNPHFLYNTLDAIRIQAQLDGDQKVADLLMRLVDFFRRSVKVNHSMVEMDDELELLEAYMELMCYRYPDLQCEYDIDQDLLDMQVPNFILQPIVENSLLHGLKNKGYRGLIRISAQKVSDKTMEITIFDTGSGFAPGKKAQIDSLLTMHAKHVQKLEGNSIGVLNVQKRIKLLCGEKFGLSYTENPEGGLTAHILLPADPFSHGN